MRNRQRYRSNKHGAYCRLSLPTQRMELQIIIKEWKAVTKDRHYSQLWAVDIVLGLMGAPTTSLMTSHSLGMSMDGIDVSNISLFEGSKNQRFDEMW